MCFASTSVTIPSSLAKDLTCAATRPVSQESSGGERDAAAHTRRALSSTKKVCATGAGSAMPVLRTCR